MSPKGSSPQSTDPNSRVLLTSEEERTIVDVLSRSTLGVRHLLETSSESNELFHRMEFTSVGEYRKSLIEHAKNFTFEIHAEHARVHNARQGIRATDPFIDHTLDEDERPREARLVASDEKLVSRVSSIPAVKASIIEDARKEHYAHYEKRILHVLLDYFDGPEVHPSTETVLSSLQESPADSTHLYLYSNSPIASEFLVIGERGGAHFYERFNEGIEQKCERILKGAYDINLYTQSGVLPGRSFLFVGMKQ